jgi:hypothetical protein
MGSLFTTGKTAAGVAAGTEIDGIVAGAVFLDFMAGTITLPEGSTVPLTRPMNKNLNDLGLQQCNSIGIWCSDADAQYQIGSAVSLADHQLNHVICNYGFNTVRIDIPDNSTPAATNQIFFQASTDGWLGYSFPRISHQRGELSDTSTNSQVVYLSKHVGAYNQFLITTDNTGSNSIDVVVEFSENGTDFFPDSGYTTAVAVAGGSYNAFASEVEHHFYRVQVNSTGAGSHSNFTIHYNFVNDRGSAFL